MTCILSLLAPPSRCWCCPATAYIAHRLTNIAIDILFLGAGPTQPLLVLPGYHLPMANLTFILTQRLPGGRSPLEHYLFPIIAPGEAIRPGAVQVIFGWVRGFGVGELLFPVIAPGRRSGLGTAGKAHLA